MGNITYNKAIDKYDSNSTTISDIAGGDKEYNWITTSMSHNFIKSNWDHEQIGWKFFSSVKLNYWTSLTCVFINIVEKDSILLKDAYIKKWYTLAKTMYIDK